MVKMVPTEPLHSAAAGAKGGRAAALSAWRPLGRARPAAQNSSCTLTDVEHDLVEVHVTAHAATISHIIVAANTVDCDGVAGGCV